jgi:long-chain acyl-CoA synthetase
MVALCSVVRLEWYIADFACTLLGIPTVGITASSDKETSGYILNQTETSIVVCSWEHLDMFMSLADKECPNIREIVVMDLNENENVLIVKPITSQRLRIWQFTEFLAVGAKDLIDYTQFRTDPKELFTICYTSGSTGQPKGCVFSRELWLRQILIPTNFGILGIKRIWFSFQPPSHMMEREAFHLTLASGCKAGIYRGSMEYLFEDIRMVRPTVVTSTPRFFSIIYNQFLQGIYDEYRKYLLDNKLDDESSLLPANLLEASNSVFKSGASKVPFEVKEKVKEKFKDYLGGREKVIGVGGAAVSPELKKFLSFCFDALVQEGYGTTEVGGITNGDWYSHDVTIRLRDVPEMGYLTTDDPPRGEICVKTNHMISGYYKNLEKTQEKFQDGYFCTGDIGVMEGQGHLRIIDRKKNIFKLAQGEFVVPERLELIYEANSSLVEQCYIHGNIYQSQVVAVIVPHKEALMEVLEQEELLDQEFANDVRVMCGSTKIKEIILKELRSVGDTHKLHGWEIPLGVVLEPHPFTEANNLLTSTLKKRRLQLEQKYKEELEELYVTAAAQGVSLLENMSDMQILSIEERILICLLDVLIKKGFEVASSKYLSDSSLGHQLDLNLTLTQLGGDSLTAMRLSNAIEDQASVSIPAVAILNQPLTSVFELVISKLQPSPSPSDALPSQDEPVKKIDWDKEISIQFLHISSSAVKLSPTSSYTTKDNNNSVVLLTGCSGFLGKFILWELIKSKNSIQVYCIIRRYEGMCDNVVLCLG